MTFKAAIFTIYFSVLLAGMCASQDSSPNAVPMRRSQSTLRPTRHFYRTRSEAQQFLKSDEGRAFLKATGHPLADYAIAAFGEPSKETVVPARWLRQSSPSATSTVPAAVPCTGATGARFNLEPRVNAFPQNEAMADFLPNRVGPADDLIVQAANDWRGNVTSAHWDQNVSGYYVHRLTTADCSTQFEGGLPTLTVQGNPLFGIGGTVVAADPERDAIFMGDQRFGSLSGVGLFRASASTLLDSTKCPSGTHLATQAASCWTVTPPVLVFSQPGFDLGGVQPVVAVDERPTGAGTGAGDVYVIGSGPGTSGLNILLAACTNSLSCGSGAGENISGSDQDPDFPFVRVRPDGIITISYKNTNTDGTADIKFVTCRPAGAPKLPTCTAPVLVQHLSQPIFNDLTNENLIAFTYPKLANRAESGGAFTTFLVYDDCKSPYVQGNPPFTICLGAEVVLTTSTNNGKTWSTPVSVDSAAGHHFYPAITTDPSTGIVNIAYYSAESDKFNHALRVFRNQINPGGLTVSAPQPVTKLADPIDGDPDSLALFQPDLFMGAVARGNGISGQTRLYLSFDATTVPGSYEGETVPELNNHIFAVTF